MGVPEITPLLAFNVNPVGNEPEDTEYVTDSPETEGVTEKETPFAIE